MPDVETTMDLGGTYGATEFSEMYAVPYAVLVDEYTQFTYT